MSSGPTVASNSGVAPPVVSLERMVAQVDEPVSARESRELFLVDASGQSGNPFGQARLGSRPRHQPGLVYRYAYCPSIRAWTTGIETTKSPSPNEIGAM